MRFIRGGEEGVEGEEGGEERDMDVLEDGEKKINKTV